MGKRTLLTRLFLTVYIICFISSCTKSKPTLTRNSESSIDTSMTVYPIRATNKHLDWTDEEGGDTLSISINNFDFTIYPDGLLKWGNKNTVLLSKDMYATIAYFQFVDNDLLLFCEMSDFETGTTDIFRIDLSNKHIKWKANLPGFNLGQPAIRGNYGYVTAIGSVGKLDLETGKFLYNKSNLYDTITYSFNNFDTIIFKENKTYFVSKRSENISDTVIFDESTNKITIKKSDENSKIATEDDFETNKDLSKLNDNKTVSKGDFNGDGKLENMWLVPPKLDDEGMACVGDCISYIKFSDPTIPNIKIKDCIDGKPDNVGDLNKDGADEIGILPGWFAGGWRSYYVWTLKSSLWIYAVQPFTTHRNQWDENIKPIEIDLKKDGNVIVRYSESTETGIITKSKSVPIY